MDQDVKFAHNCRFIKPKTGERLKSNLENIFQVHCDNKTTSIGASQVKPNYHLNIIMWSKYVIM